MSQLPLTLVVPDDRAEERLDKMLAALCPELSRASARRLIERGSVFVNGARVKVASRVVWPKHTLVVHGELSGVALGEESEAPPIPILHDSSGFLIVNKPSGVFSAPTPETDKNDLLCFLKETYGQLYVVHRLDRPTSGVMVLAKTKKAAAHLSQQLIERTLKRSYLTILTGTLAEGDITCDKPLSDKEARTRFTVLERAPSACLVRAELDTGRMHQIRLHAEHLGHPVAGDSKYGRFMQRSLAVRAPRLCLHAERLNLLDPDSGTPLEVSAPFPDELTDYFRKLVLEGEAPARPDAARS